MSGLGAKALGTGLTHKCNFGRVVPAGYRLISIFKYNQNKKIRKVNVYNDDVIEIIKKA